MGTIIARPRKDGTTAYLAQIILKRDGQVVHQESKTFDRRPAARAWIEKREQELRQPGAIEQAARPRATLADAIDRYTEDSIKRIGKTKAQVLDAIKRLPIAAKQADQITATDIVAFAQSLVMERQPSTVGNYLSHLASVFAIARPAWNIPLDRQAMADAIAVCRRLGIIARSKRRDRRPTLDELDKLLTFFTRRRANASPMHRIIAFAIFSTRRLEEIITIRWRDLDGDRILVRDMKHPGQKDGNDTWCDLPPEAVRIIEAMPRRKDQIFPYNVDAISAAFTRACKILAIEDLHFHDLRHDGISRQFEIGKNIPQAAAVSGHRSWSSLQRYTHIRQTGDKYKDWKWLEIVTRPTTPQQRRLLIDPCSAAP